MFTSFVCNYNKLVDVNGLYKYCNKGEQMFSLLILYGINNSKQKIQGKTVSHVKFKKYKHQRSLKANKNSRESCHNIYVSLLK